MNRFKARVPLIGFAQNEGPLPATAYPLLENRLPNGVEAGRIWLVTVGRQPAEPTNQIEAWLARNAFKASDNWLDKARLLNYGLSRPSQVVAVNQTLDETIHLLEVNRPRTINPGQILPVTFKWQAISPPSVDYIIFVQMIDLNGRLVAQYDGPPQGGYLPTSQWPIDEILIDRHGVSLPEELSPGEYRLITGLYNPVDGARLPTATGPDFVDLGIVTVTR